MHVDFLELIFPEDSFFTWCEVLLCFILAILTDTYFNTYQAKNKPTFLFVFNSASSGPSLGFATVMPISTAFTGKPSVTRV